MQLLVLEGLLLYGLSSAQLVAPVDNGNLAGKLCQVHCLFNGRIAAADNVNFHAFKESGVASGAEGNALANELAFVLAAYGAGESTGGQYNGFGIILALGANELFNIARELNALYRIARTLCAELFGLLRHAGDKAGA